MQCPAFMKPSLPLYLLLPSLLATACGTNDRPAAVVHEPPPSTTPPAAGSTTTTTRNDPAPARPPAIAPTDTAAGPVAATIAQAEVVALLEAWKAAQNARDIAAYSRLYAARFEGVRRAGDRERRFDRAGWLADRRNMMSLPVSVETSDVHVSAAGQSVLVRFTQRFSAGQFRDEGPKEMVVVREGGALRIAREEMLASNVLSSSASSVAAAARGDFMPVLGEGDVPQSYVVLHAEPDEAWGTGRITLLTARRPMAQVVVTRRAASAVPAELAAWRGREVHLFDEQGQRCSAHLDELFLLSRVDVHFGTEMTWAGDTDGDGQPDGPPSTLGEIAGSAYGQGLLLVASLRERTCAGLWARAADRPAPTVFASRAPSADESTRAVAAFRGLPAWRTLQTDYAADGSATPNGKWDEHDGARPVVRTWVHAASNRQYLTVSGQSSTGGCADFSGHLWAVFEVSGATLVLRSDGARPTALVPEAMADVDGDGAPEVITAAGLARRRGTSWSVVENVAHADLDCGC